VLEVDDLVVELQSEAAVVRAVDGLRLAIRNGETFALVGESGCGKSMTALALMRLLPDNGGIAEGHVRLGGLPLLDLPEARMRGVRGGRIGMIFQEPATSLNPVMRVGDQVVEAIERHTALRSQAARDKAVDWLRRVGIPEPERRAADYPFRMSGGQKQRVMIAMTLAGEPDFIVADEPTTALDVTIQAQILQLLKDLQQEHGVGLLLITHDLAVVAGMAHRVALMYAGQIVEVAPAERFFTAPRHPYAQALLRALPSAGRRSGTLEAIPGTVPSLDRSFVGCRFAPRCAMSEARCLAAAAPLVDLNAEHQVRCVRLDELPPPRRTAPRASEAAPAAPTAAGAQPPAPAPALLSVRDLRVSFPIRGGLLQRTQGWFPAVRSVSFDVPRGRTLALVGESGCGKTTTGKAIVQLLGQLARIEGEALLDGQDLFSLRGSALQAARRRVQIIFQDPFGSLDPRMRVRALLEEGVASLLPDLDPSARRRRVEALAEQVGLRREALSRWPHEFSGGQRQRIAIARALAVQPELLVCDEPTSALDVSVQAQILNLLRELQRELGVSYLFITHNIGVVEYIADQVAVMRAGAIEEQGPAGPLLAAPASAYARTLLASVPRIDP
jgi:peptide/nickel transport system ATP-binding protein